MKQNTKSKQLSRFMVIGVLLICAGLIGLSAWFLFINVSDIGAESSETIDTREQETRTQHTEELPEEELVDDEPIMMDVEIIETLPQKDDSAQSDSEQADIDSVPEQEQTEESDYILNSDIVLLTEEDVRHLTLQQLSYARNEIYARHGRRFKSAELQAYFDQQSWYRGTIEPADFDESVLSTLEKTNIEFLRKYERSLDPNGYKLDAGS